MNSINRWQVDPNRIDFILVSHLHVDHFGGIPFFIIHAQLHAKRTRPLLIAGPPGLKDRMREAMEVMFPGSSTVERKFVTELIELDQSEPARIGSLSVTPYPVVHACGAVPYAYRIECGGKIIAYSGDTQWTDGLLSAAKGADLFICEAYYFERQIKFHMSYKTLKAHEADLGCKRTIITHMSNDVLSRLDSVEVEYAEDGMRLSV
jgi:ribonuclease BN (tRNA processing enzyme)